MLRPIRSTLFLLLVAAPAVGETQRVQAGDGSGSYFLASAGTTLVGGAGGARLLELEPGAHLFDLKSTGGGWTATGGLWTGDRREIFLVRQEEGEKAVPLAPPPAEGAVRGNAVLLVDAGKLAGLAWLEGASPLHLEVRAAPWSEEGDWGATEVLGSFRPGEQQVGLRGAILDDGSWLLVWNSVDGEDDELIWSRRQEGRWSPPRRLHADNQVPDVTLALAAVDGGALVVWSWFDGGDYRLKSARFDGREWHESEPFGERGSIEPTLTRREEGLWLLFKTVSPESWSVVEFDRAGFATRSAALPGPTGERPLLTADEEGQPVLAWPMPTSAPERTEALAWGTRP